MPQANEFALMGGFDYWSGIEIPPVLVCADGGLVRVELQNHGGHSHCLKPNHDLGLAVEVDKVLVSGLVWLVNQVIFHTYNHHFYQGGRHCGTSDWCRCRSRQYVTLTITTAIRGGGGGGGSPLRYQRLLRLSIPLIF